VVLVAPLYHQLTSSLPTPSIAPPPPSSLFPPQGTANKPADPDEAADNASVLAKGHVNEIRTGRRRPYPFSPHAPARVPTAVAGTGAAAAAGVGAGAGAGAGARSGASVSGKKGDDDDGKPLLAIKVSALIGPYLHI